MSDQTLTGTLKIAAAKFPHRRALSIPSKLEITYSQLDDLIDSAASRLISANILPGDVVALIFPNTIEFVIMFLAVIRSRATAAPLNASYTQEEFEFYLSDSESKLLVTSKQGNNAAALNAAAKLNLPCASATLTDPSIFLQIDGLPENLRSSVSKTLINDSSDSESAKIDLPCANAKLTDPSIFLRSSVSKTLINDSSDSESAKIDLPCANAKLTDPSIFLRSSVSETLINDPSDIALFLHTSGTTSRPKGVPLSQQNLAASAKNIRSVYKLTESDSTLIVLPLFHVHGLIAGVLSSLTAGAGVSLPETGRFSASTFWADMRATGATWYTAVPTIHQILLDRHESASEAPYPSLRFIRSCSASLAPAVLLKLEATFKAPVLEAYAMTEASHLMCANPLPEDGPHKAGSVGRPVGQEIAILDENGVVRPDGFSGEVCIRGVNVTKGYRNNPEANKAAFLHGWFHTGDVGFVDEDGFVHLVGRIKELINRGGEKISPIEVDAVLLAHPRVAQAVAFGVPDEKYGEEINCAVIPREGTEIDVEEMKSFCKKNLASFKVPKKIFVTESLPKTATGKIQRRIVAEQFLDLAKTTKVGA